MVLRDVAEDIGMHESTVSRVVSNKYIHTPRGLFPLKFFFTGGTAKDSGEVESQVSIKERIREIVAGEDSQKPLSDDQIAALLEERETIEAVRFVSDPEPDHVGRKPGELPY